MEESQTKTPAMLHDSQGKNARYPNTGDRVRFGQVYRSNGPRDKRPHKQKLRSLPASGQAPTGATEIHKAAMAHGLQDSPRSQTASGYAGTSI